MLKLAIPIIITAFVLVFLINSAVEESAKKVLTVTELRAEVLKAEAPGSSFVTKERIRLGARVASSDIKVTSEPLRQVSFYIKDIEGAHDETLLVKYNGLMPDTLREGRDVILEGDFDGSIFYANTLNTQCPSKYEPPDPLTGKKKEYSSEY